MKNKLIWLFAHNVPKQVRHTFTIEIIAGIFIAIGAGCFGPYYALIAQKSFDAGQFLIGLMTAGMAVGALVCILTSGLVPAGKEQAAYVISCCIARLFIVLMAFANCAPVYCWMAFFVNLFTCLPGPQYNIMMQRLYPIKYRGRLMGLARLNVALFLVLTIFISGIFMKNSENWRAVFVIGGVSYITASLLYLLWKVPPAKETKNSVIKNISGSLKLLGEEKIHLQLIIILTVITAAANIQSIILPIYQADRLNITPHEISILSVLSNIASMSGYVFWGRFIDKKGSAAAYGLQAIIAVTLPLSYFIAPNWLWIIPASFLIGFANSGGELAWITLIMELAKPGQEVRVQTLHAFFNGIRGLLGIAIGVYLISFVEKLNIDIKYVFLIIIVLQLSGTVPFILAAEKYRKANLRSV